MTDEIISTNTSRRSSIGIFSIETAENQMLEISTNTSRRSSIGSFSRILLDNDTEEDILQGTIKLNTYTYSFYPFHFLLFKIIFSTIFCDNFLPNDECLVEFI